MNRRQWMAAGVGATAAAVGAGVAWWRLKPGAPVDGAVEALWASEFAGVNGERVRVSGFRGKPLLVNFWATWCPPCVEELPLLNLFHREHAGRGWQVLGLAVDQATPVARFLQRVPLTFPVALAGFAGTEMSRSLGNVSGALPFSVVFGADGRVRHRKLGKLSGDELAQWSQID